jgi:hypothetical protein
MLGLGAMLTQCDDEGKEFVVAYVSCLNNAAESRYSSYEGECLAVVWAVALQMLLVWHTIYPSH